MSCALSSLLERPVMHLLRRRVREPCPHLSSTELSSRDCGQDVLLKPEGRSSLLDSQETSLRQSGPPGFIAVSRAPHLWAPLPMETPRKCHWEPRGSGTPGLPDGASDAHTPSEGAATPGLPMFVTWSPCLWSCIFSLDPPQTLEGRDRLVYLGINVTYPRHAICSCWVNAC